MHSIQLLEVFYLIRTGFTKGKPIVLVKVFRRVFRLERIVFGMFLRPNSYWQGQRVCDALLLTMLTKNKEPLGQELLGFAHKRCLFSIGAFVIVVFIMCGALSLSLLSLSFSLSRLEPPPPLTPNSFPFPIKSPTKPSHHHHHHHHDVGSIHSFVCNNNNTSIYLGSHPFPRVTCNPPPFFHACGKPCKLLLIIIMYIITQKLPKYMMHLTLSSPTLLYIYIQFFFEISLMLFLLCGCSKKSLSLQGKHIKT